MANETVFKRYHGNPVVTAANVPRANSIHNSAVVRYGDAYAGVFRVDQLDFTYRLHVGFSKDGINWDIDPEYIRMQSEDPDVVMADQSYDPRVVEIEGTYYVTWCNCFPRGPGIGLAWTKDFKTFHQMEDPFPAEPERRPVPKKAKRQLCDLPPAERLRADPLWGHLLHREPRPDLLGQAPVRLRPRPGVAEHKGRRRTGPYRDERWLAAHLPRRLELLQRLSVLRGRRAAGFREAVEGDPSNEGLSARPHYALRACGRRP